MEWVVVAVYSFSLLVIFIYSFSQLHLTWIYKKKTVSTPEYKTDSFLPQVTIQLPIYNEKYVVGRLIDCICSLDYPKDKLEIQILDDSTDETVDIALAKVVEYQSLGIDIQHIQRPIRKEFKAGALAYGTDRCKGEFIAIFDSDFLPRPAFLKETINHFQNEKIGMVQTRWGHVNEDYSLLTKMQAFGLDAHFTVEQVGRNKANSFMNFNGTGGVWRKTCIEDAGGWSGQTLTEDLDLSYRAQLKGWKFQYIESLDSPAELPVEMSAIKSQQYRWNKGAAETAKKNLGQFLRSNESMQTKFHGLCHLLNSSVFIFLLLTALLSIPMLYIKEANPTFELIFDIGSVFLVGFASICVFYYQGLKRVHPEKVFVSFLKKFPLFLSFSMGLSLHNAMAVLEGYLGFKSPFVRTPKFNVLAKKDTWTQNQYLESKITWGTWMEGVLCLYFLFGIGSAWFLADFGLIIFHVLLTFGFGLIFFLSIKHRYAH